MAEEMDFVHDSVLDILIPEVSGLDIEDALHLEGVTRSELQLGLIGSIPQRKLLFFDEKLPLYVVLRTKYLEESLLKSYISRIGIVLEAHAISSAQVASADGKNEARASEARDVIWTGRVDVSKEPIMAVEDSEDEGGQRHVLLIWKLLAFLSRPRIRLQVPAIIFKLSGSLQPMNSRSEKQALDSFLPSLLPLPSNLLQPIHDDPGLHGALPMLSSQRLSRSVPVVRSPRSDSFPLKATSRKAFRAVPALSSRMRYHSCALPAGTPAITASLELEIPGFAQHDVELEMVDVQLSNGKATPLVQLHLPVRCRPQDNIICLYSLRLPNFANESSLQAQSRSLDISINAIVLVSERCRPEIEIRWNASVDVASTTTPSTVQGSLQRTHRPANLSAIPKNTNAVVVAVPRSISHPPHQNSSSTGQPGLTITLTALGDVYIGEPFRWRVFIVNRSEKSRQLVLTVISSKRTESGKKYPLQPSIPTKPEAGKSTIAAAVVDEKILHSTMNAHTAVLTQIVSLTPDLKIGLLEPGKCHETELIFLPLETGVLHLEAIRVVDLATNEAMDIKDLPDVIAAKRVVEKSSLT